MESTFKMEKKNEFCIWDVSKETITEKLEVIKIIQEFGNQET